MQAVILAAGMGKRLKKLTQNNTKCMVRVNGRTLIERALGILDKKGLSRIVVVVGYEAQNLIKYIRELEIKTPIQFIDNPVYDKTNNIYSLVLAEEFLVSEDTLILESDLIFEEEIIDLILNDPRATLALADKFESWMDGTCMVLDEEDCICDFISGKHLNFREKEKYYKTVNIYKFSQHFSQNTYVPFLKAYKAAMGDNEYYESVIKLIALLDTKEIRAKRLTGQIWYEIDDIQDLDIAESLFVESVKKRYEMIAERYGGYWRYPKLMDFCCPVNPYYPSEKMMEEMKANFETLLTQCPSGMRVNSLLAGKRFGISDTRIVMGNGAAELMASLLGMLTGKVGFIRSTFEEYPNRLEPGRCVVMTVDNNDFSYTAADIITYFSENPVETIVLINPDDQSGNYIGRAEVESLIAWCRAESVYLILDDSFVDFVDNGKTFDELTIISDEVLDQYEEGLFVIKSVSKSHGVPGVRLGVLASANKAMISAIKQKLPTWNINSFGEFYMQIVEKYTKDYQTALDRLVLARRHFYEKLEQIPWLRAIPSEANYILCEITGQFTGSELACHLLKKNIFVKDLSEKIGNGRQYLRFAVRREEENDYLTRCLTELSKT